MRSEPELDLKTVDLDGYPLTYAEAGQGDPLVLVHGSLCDCRYWKPQLTSLARHFHVFSLSLRHYWPEDWDGSGEGFSITQHTADVLAFIDALAGGSAHLVGHSRGGRIAVEAALHAPARVRSLVLADPGMTRPGEDERGDFRQRALTLIQAGDPDAGLALFIDTVTGPDTWRRMVPWFKDMVRDNAKTVLGQAREPTVPVGDVAALSMPVLLIGGALSPPPYPAMLDRLQTLLPQAQRIAIAGSSHGMNLGNPRAFNQAIVDFLA
ncbi:alpha/beta fold hydrolase [Bordetella holmesii]|nr:alpha/beta hydrolase [Bordetella holmesii]AHV94482.1 alpha/beta hydrolase fold family protein [Bordetella holmesii ATCC 51541]AIT26761.1 alpha/beta hydrolase fold family protein [Bordetella holmesii 44057]EWM44199.1 alpha/beta hydrolase fold family protein [Bordetella holmesii 41130]EWM47351.1 alpha/beta hydrolase fold family protein [Bordetella holmesii 35009]EWM51509.1 alpha/beta hydrolase fold family protein [Bordetella holmesii 70147]